MTPGEQLKAWRAERKLGLCAAGAVIGCSSHVVRTAEKGRALTTHSAALVLAATGVAIPGGARRGKRVNPALKRGAQHCPRCFGLSHRRPHAGCQCGQPWAPEIVQHPVPGLRSSASWCGDYAAAKDTEDES